MLLQNTRLSGIAMLAIWDIEAIHPFTGENSESLADFPWVSTRAYAESYLELLPAVDWLDRHTELILKELREGANNWIISFDVFSPFSNWVWRAFGVTNCPIYGYYRKTEFISKRQWLSKERFFSLLAVNTVPTGRPVSDGISIAVSRRLDGAKFSAFHCFHPTFGLYSAVCFCQHWPMQLNNTHPLGPFDALKTGGRCSGGPCGGSAWLQNWSATGQRILIALFSF